MYLLRDSGRWARSRKAPRAARPAPAGWPAASAASTSSGGSSRPISAAFPESSAHRCTRASRAAASRRFCAFLGATSMTARRMAARSPPGVSRPARSSTFFSAARASAASSSAVADTMTSALYREITPSRSAVFVPGSRVSSARAKPSRPFARPRDSAGRDGPARVCVGFARSALYRRRRAAASVGIADQR